MVNFNLNYKGEIADIKIPRKHGDGKMLALDVRRPSAIPRRLASGRVRCGYPWGEDLRRSPLHFITTDRARFARPNRNQLACGSTVCCFIDHHVASRTDLHRGTRAGVALEKESCCREIEAAVDATIARRHGTASRAVEKHRPAAPGRLCAGGGALNWPKEENGCPADFARQ